MFIIKYRKIFFAISSIIIALSFISMFTFGLKFGIDFTGGDIIEVSYPEQKITRTVLVNNLDTLEIGAYSLREAGENSYILRTKPLSESQRTSVLSTLGGTVERLNSVGPTIGQELRSKAWWAVIMVVLSIILFIAFVFREVSEPVSSWKYGVVAIIALLHDVIVPFGVFAYLGAFGAEVDILFIMALLAIIGYSVNDTIVVFDRVREHLKDNQERNKHEDFAKTVGKALNETFTRSINTSITTLIVLIALFILGGTVTHFFALTLIAGVIAGTYSSLFLATPLLVAISKTK